MTIFMLSKERFDLLRKVRECAKQHGVECFLIGGIVRDILLLEEVHETDIDLVVVGPVYSFADALQTSIGGRIIPFKNFLTAKITGLHSHGECTELDLAQARKEVYESPGALPEVHPATLEEDLARRDFTVNAIALSVTELLKSYEPDTKILRLDDTMLVDPRDGYGALRRRELQVLHSLSFIDDPTRIVRMYRYQNRLGFSVEEQTHEYAQNALKARCFSTISLQRLWNEVRKCLAEQSIKNLFPRLFHIGCFDERTGSQLLGPKTEKVAHMYAEAVETFSVVERAELFHLMAIYELLGEAGYEMSRALGEIGSMPIGAGISEYFSRIGVGKKSLKELMTLFQQLVGRCSHQSDEHLVLLEILISEYSSEKMKKGNT